MSESSLSPGPLSWIIVCWTGNKPSPRNSVRLDSMLMLLSFAFCKAFYFNLITLLTLQNISVWLNWFIVNIGVKNIQMFFVFHFWLGVVCVFSCLSQSPTIDMGRAEPGAACVLCASLCQLQRRSRWSQDSALLVVRTHNPSHNLPNGGNTSRSWCALN